MTLDNRGYIVAHMKTLAERFRYARKEAGLTQAALGEKVGLSQQMIRKIEMGSETSRTVELASALGVRPEWLATGAEPMIDPTGTSFAAPLAAAALSRLMQAASKLSPEQILSVAVALEGMQSPSNNQQNNLRAATRTITPDGTIRDRDASREEKPNRKRAK